MIRGLVSRRGLVCLLGFVLLCGFFGVVSAAEPAAPAAPPGYLQYQDPAAKPAGTVWGTVAYILSLILLFIGVVFLAYLSSRF